MHDKKGGATPDIVTSASTYMRAAPLQLRQQCLKHPYNIVIVHEIALAIVPITLSKCCSFNYSNPYLRILAYCLNIMNII